MAMLAGSRFAGHIATLDAAPIDVGHNAVQ
jgi:hypothetical protein